MTAGFHAPLPPSRTGVADYAAALLAELRKGGDVAVNAPGGVNLYHLGNNPLHRGIYRQALARPGVAVLHDAVLHHFFLGSLGERGYIEEFTFNYGPWFEDVARTLWAERARSAADPRYFAYPMLRRIAEASRAVVVHNPAAARMVLRHAPTARVREIPHLVLPGDEPPAYEVERLRRSWGIPGGGVVFGVFGHLRESKRVSAVLRAFRRVRKAAPGARLLLAGEFASPDLERNLSTQPAMPGLIRMTWTGAAQFAALISAADVCINLRYPAAGETSGIVIRAMAAGRPVMVTAGEETSRFPEHTSVPIDPGPGEEDMLVDAMLWMAGTPAARAAMGRAAREYVRRVHAPAVAARLYWEVLRQAGGETCSGR